MDHIPGLEDQVENTWSIIDRDDPAEGTEHHAMLHREQGSDISLTLQGGHAVDPPHQAPVIQKEVPHG